MSPIPSDPSPSVLRCLELLRQMVGIDSVNASLSGRAFPEQELALFLERTAYEHGLDVHRSFVDGTRYNLLISGETQPGRPWVVFDSHMDTVGIENMTVPALEGMISGNRFFGRGACDTKGSGAAMLTGLIDAAQSGTLANNVSLLFSVDEESGKTGASGFCRTAESDFGRKPDAVVVGEPTSMRPVVTHNGLLRLRIKTNGVSVHASRPELGRSAISAALRVIDRIEQKYAPSLSKLHPLTGLPRCSVNTITGGTQFNVTAGTCSFEVDRRVVPGEEISEIIGDFERMLTMLRNVGHGLEAEIIDVTSETPMRPIGLSPIMSWIEPTFARLGLPCEPSGVPYGTNAGRYTDAGFPAVVIGPGDIAQAHTTDEWIDISQLELAVELYASLMQTPFPAKNGT